MVFNLDSWHSGKLNKYTLFDYIGKLEENDVSNILDRIDKILRDNNESPKVLKKAYNVLVELLQNLYHHGVIIPEHHGEFDRFGVIVLQQETSCIRVCTGNFIAVKDIKLIRDRIDQINMLSPEEAKSLYRLVLNNESFSDKGGGGLGMVDIARKTGNKLEYQFHDYNQEYIFLALDVLISKN